MKCKLCGKEKKLIRAHVIPRCFFEIVSSQVQSPAIISTSEGFRPLRRRIGVYDKNILCRDCEDKFQNCDNYACSTLLRGRENATSMYDSNGVEAVYLYPENDYELLRQFFLSVLLRAELSSDFFFQHVKLGPYREKLRKYFNGTLSISENDFSVFTFYYPELNSGPLLVPPNKMLISGIRFYHFHLGRVGFCIKVDRRPCPRNLEPMLLRRGRPLSVFAKQFNGTHLHEIVIDMLNNPRNAEYFAK